MNSWSSPFSTLTNFTIDNNRTFDNYDYNYLRDLVLCTFIWFMVGNFLEGFERYLRRPINEDDNDHLGFDFFDYMMFFD